MPAAEVVRRGEEPADDCTAHQFRAIDRRNGLLATADTPRSEIEVRIFVSRSCCPRFS